MTTLVTIHNTGHELQVIIGDNVAIIPPNSGDRIFEIDADIKLMVKEVVPITEQLAFPVSETPSFADPITAPVI